MVTTIQLNENVRKILDRMKTGRETYEDVILGLIKAIDDQKRKREELIIEGCKEMYDENLKIAKEFEAIEDLTDWEWKDD